MINLFGSKRAATIKDVLAKDTVKRVVDDFVTEHLPTAQAVIIIWATDGELYANSGGVSESEAIGLLEITKHEIQHKGVPQR